MACDCNKKRHTGGRGSSIVNDLARKFSKGTQSVIGVYFVDDVWKYDEIQHIQQGKKIFARYKDGVKLNKK